MPIIRDALLRDVPLIAELEKSCFSLPWSEEIIAAEIASEGRVFLVAELDGVFAGYLGLQYVLDEGYITNVCVAPEARRRGVGNALLAELERRARELSLLFLTLEVRESNAPARALYASRGYEIVGLRRNYYERPRENAVLMTLFFNRESDS